LKKLKNNAIIKKLEYLIFTEAKKMKKEKLNWYILIACLALTGLFAILTVVYLIKSFNVFGVVALMVDIFAVGVIIYCFLQEQQEERMQAGREMMAENVEDDFDQPNEEDIAEGENEVEPVTVESVEEPAEESNGEVAEYEKAPEDAE
jgi:hypothetical protein